jgi:hypothetical protein
MCLAMFNLANISKLPFLVDRLSVSYHKRLLAMSDPAARLAQTGVLVRSAMQWFLVLQVQLLSLTLNN